MRHPPLLSLLSSTMPSSSSSLSPTPRKPSAGAAATTAGNHHSAAATATLDLLILILVLFSGAFLLSSYFSYLFRSLSLLLSNSSSSFSLLLIAAVAAAAAVAIEVCYCTRLRRRCGNPKCKGMKKAMEFDLQLQTEEFLKQGGNEIDRLPWKGGSETNPDYECLRVELRKMAPLNGRAVLLFRAKCGCPVAKLVGWGPKKGRKHKKALASVATNGDHRWRG